MYYTGCLASEHNCRMHSGLHQPDWKRDARQSAGQCCVALFKFFAAFLYFQRYYALLFAVMAYCLKHTDLKYMQCQVLRLEFRAPARAAGGARFSVYSAPRLSPWICRRRLDVL